ncbi:hypothetical protein WBP07_07770 [Novosphingobium sp. BL-8A]
MTKVVQRLRKSGCYCAAADVARCSLPVLPGSGGFEAGVGPEPADILDIEIAGNDREAPRLVIPAKAGIPLSFAIVALPCRVSVPQVAHSIPTTNPPKTPGISTGKVEVFPDFPPNFDSLSTQ